MSPALNNTQKGSVVLLAATNLAAAIAAGTDIRGTLVKLAAGGKVEIPAAATDITPYIVEDVLDSTHVTVCPFSRDRNFRLELSGTGSAGDPITHDTGAYGKGKKWTTGAAHVVGFAEEDWVAGQKTLFRPYPYAAS